MSNATVDGVTYPNGNCYATPEAYGVTVYRMGLCTSNPAPTGAGSAPQVSDCTFTYINMDGEAESFASGGSATLSSEFSFNPDVGSYRYAVIEIGNTWTPGHPTQSLIEVKALMKFMEDGGFHLCQEFVWFNPAKLPGPAEWVTKYRERVKKRNEAK